MKSGEKLTGAELSTLAEKHIDDDFLERAFKDPVFKDFARICLLFQVTASVTTNQKQQFGHCFVLRESKTKKSTNVEFQVVVTSTEIEGE